MLSCLFKLEYIGSHFQSKLFADPEKARWRVQRFWVCDLQGRDVSGEVPGHAAFLERQDC